MHGAPGARASQECQVSQIGTPRHPADVSPDATGQARDAAPAKAGDRSATRVAVLGLRGFPNVQGGVESHCGQIYPRLARMSGRRFTVLARRSYMPEPATLADGLDIRPIWSVRNKHLEALLHTIWGVVFAVLVYNPELIHLHAIGPGLFTPIAKLFGKRVVVTHHGQDYNRPKWNAIGRWTLRLGEWLSVRFADRVIVVSRSVAEMLQRRHPSRASRIAYIPNGAARMPNDPDPAATLAKYDLQPHGFILSVGRLVPSKCFDDLIEAHRKSGLDAKLVIAGGADHADEYSRALVQRASDRVVFTGALRQEALSTLYANASVFVLASSHEGLPIAALEAMAAGAPTIMSDIQPNLDVELPGHHYFPLHDADALAAKLRTPCETFAVPESFSMAPYDWDRVVEQTEAVYAAALRR
ncbi:MAG: glycosyltransferase [Alphaproteobacteria bacterium]|nr:glycosyltransferase [Alphaproteobacteria bacterium]